MLKKNLFVLGAGAMLLAGGASADVLTPVTVDATSWWPGAEPIHLIDGSGLTSNDLSGTHDNQSGAVTMWHASGGGQGVSGGAAVVADQDLTFDLGALYDLTNTHVWNHNQNSGANEMLRGVATMDILVSADGVTYASVVGGSTSLAIASGTASEGAQDIATVASGVRYVRFEIQTAHSAAANEYVGLSEVKFEGTPVPEPGSLALLGLGGLMIARRRRA